MTDAEEDFRVQCSSKRSVCEAVQQYGLLLGKVLDRQSQISEELRSRALQDLQWNFETAVQKNVVINGESWDDAPDDPVNVVY
nr:PREDICTED: kinetochore-associated protein NSL1 homolog [Lepisosteus oculatus]